MEVCGDPHCIITTNFIDLSFKEYVTLAKKYIHETWLWNSKNIEINSMDENIKQKKNLNKNSIGT